MAEMKNFFLFILIILLGASFSISQTHTLKGLITMQSSGSMPVVGAQVKARGATPTRTDKDGKFELVFLDKKEGFQIVLEIMYKECEVVNEKDLVTILRANQEDLIKIYMCKKGFLDQNRIKYYNIAVEHITKQYELKIRQLNKSIKAYRENLLRLKKEQEELIKQAEELADKFARVNFDDVSELYKKALTHFNVGKIKKAIEVLDDDELEKNLKKAERIKKQTIETYMLKARLCKLDYRFERAEKYYDIAVKADSTNYDNIYELSDFYYKQKKYSKSIQLSILALSVAKNDNQKSYVLHKLGALYWKTDEYQKSMYNFNKALEIRKHLAKNDTKFIPDLADTFNAIGVLYCTNNQYESAKKYFETAVELYEKIVELKPDTVNLYRLSNCLENLGLLYEMTNNFHQAEIFYMRSIEIRKELAKKNPTLYFYYVASTLSNMGIMYRRNGKAKEALSSLIEALEIMEKVSQINPDVNLPILADILNNLGNVYSDIKKFDMALSSYQRSLAIRENLARKEPHTYLPLVATSLHNIGELYLDTKISDQAMEFLSKALEIRENLSKKQQRKYVFDLCDTLINLAKLHKHNLEEGYGDIHRKKGLLIVKRIIKILEKYKNLPMSKDFLNLIPNLKEYFEK